MHCTTQRIDHRQTGYFSNIIIDYLNGEERVQPFYAYPPNLEGIKAALAQRLQVETNREVLVDGLLQQYSAVQTHEQVMANLQKLRNKNCFTVTTAHQPNLFTGPLYFIYKIIHAIKLSTELNEALPDYQFVPVFYLGTEDADTEELAHCYLQGKKYEWLTGQTGAFGRRVCDEKLQQLIQQMAGHIGVLPNGKAWIQQLEHFFAKGHTIGQATFALVNALFGEWGLVVVNPDNAAFKQLMIPVFEKELFERSSAGIVARTSASLAQHYKVQATGRDINLFYLVDDVRERIEADGEGFKVVNTSMRFTAEAMRTELYFNPERFSPNVILRGLYQEKLLPNVAFIGGGGELAYWMQLKQLFEHYDIPYPVLILRNSFLLIEKKWQQKMERLGLATEHFFQPVAQLLDGWVKMHTSHTLHLQEEIGNIQAQYTHIGKKVAAIDPTLAIHAEALAAKAIERLREMEKKMLRAEKRRFNDAQRQMQAIKDALFPMNQLQERIENVAYFYASYGKELLKKLYEASPALEQAFIAMTID